MNKYSVFVGFFFFCIVTVGFSQELSIIDSTINQTDTKDRKFTVVHADIITYAEDPTGSLYFKSDIQNIEVYVNYEFYGRTNLLVDKLLPGVYTIKMVKQGYFDYQFYAEVTAGQQKTLFITLEPKLGQLVFNTNPRNAQITVAGEKLTGNIIELPEGNYSIEIRAFGFNTISASLIVTHQVRRTISVVMKNATFAVSEFTVTPKSFNPANPGNLGKAKLSFLVTAAGTGTLSLYNEAGTQEAVYQFAPFETWVQEYFWNGKSSSGENLAEGNYLAQLRVSSAENPTEYKTYEKKITIDEGIYYPLLSVSAGGASTGLVVSSELFPKKTIYTSFAILPYFEIDGSSVVSAPILLSLLGTPVSWLELHAQFGIIPNSEALIPLYFDAGFKVGGKYAWFSYAGFFRYAYQTKAQTTMNALEAGLGMGLSLGFTYKALHCDVASEYVIGQTQGLLTPFESMLSLGMNVKIQDNFFALGLWYKLYSTVSREQWSFADYFVSGLEVSFLLPNTNLLLKTGFSTGTQDARIWKMQILTSLAVLF